MKTFWICIVLVASSVYANEFGDYDDYYNSFEDLENTQTFGDKPINEKTDIENDLKVEEEIQQFQKGDQDSLDDSKQLKDIIDNINDYQFEDNRDKSKENVGKQNADKMENSEAINDLEQPAVREDDNRPEEHNQNADYALLWGDDNIAPLPIPDEAEIYENEAILEETNNILEEEDADKFEAEIKDRIEAEDGNDKDQNMMLNSQENLKKIDTADADLEIKAQDNVNQDDIDAKNEESGEDTIAKAYADLNADLDKLLDTFDKLKQDEPKDDNDKEMQQDFKDMDDLMDDYDTNNFNDYDVLYKDLDQLFDEFQKEDNVEAHNVVDEGQESKDILGQTAIKSEVGADKDETFEEIVGEDNINLENISAEDFDLNNDELNEPNPDDAFEKDVEAFDTELNRIIFGDDALVDNEPANNNDNIDTNFSNNEEIKSHESESDNGEEIEIKTALVDELTSSELDDLVSQFSLLHSEDLDIHADSFEKNIAPVHITLKLDEPTIITSPDYPNPYPTNNIVDWIITGEGMGIELNITEFGVNGALGDYLLIKPGGVDDTGHEGILFTYRLTTERRYRFTDVDRLFMRFESKLGMMFFRGFVISAKMIAPISDEPQPVPEPEPVLTLPQSTTTLYLGLSVHQFGGLEDDFKELLTDMAVEYAQAKLDPEVNITSIQVHITGVHLCPMSWPDFEDCSAVTFGVTLDDDEGEQNLSTEDLEDMWQVYANKEPFVSRLSTMSIYEFAQPSSAVMTAWLVLAGGVVIAAVMLAVVLWRYSCSENYTRMKTFSDTDSFHADKKTLDLYPTPHQTLPPLYENEYKWQDDTRVDMGGFANKSYATDNMYDFESDDDVTPRDRNGAGNAKDVYKV